MARIRSIKPEFWQDYRLARDLTPEQRLFYVGLWSEADDEGRFRAHPARLKGILCPYDDEATIEMIGRWLEVLAATERLVLYTVEGEPLGQLTRFDKHQKIDHPTASKLPSPEDAQSVEIKPPNDSSRNARETLANDSRTIRAGTGNREQGVEQGTGSKPSVASKAATARSVLEGCNEITGRTLTLTTDRDRKIRARLREGFTSEQLLDAMRGAYADPFMRGENDRGRRYDDPVTVFKTGGKVEAYIEHWQRVRNGQAPVRELSKQERRVLNKTAAIMTTPLSNGGHDADG